MSQLDPFSAFLNGRNERKRMQEKAFYDAEIAHIGGRYSLEREQYRGQSAYEVERLRQSGSYGLQEREHGYKTALMNSEYNYKTGLLNQEYGYKTRMQTQELDNQLQIEDKKGILARWIEDFRGANALQVQTMKQTGAERLQENELVHQRTLFELEQSERCFQMDKAHAQELERLGRFEQLERFKIHCSQIYALEEKRFEVILYERKNLHGQILKEFDTQNVLVAGTNAKIGEMVATNVASNNDMNKAILDFAMRMAEAKMRAKIDTGSDGEAERLARDWHGK